jgi:hypothetical protein
MQSYRKRIAVQRQPKQKPKPKEEAARHLSVKKLYPEVRCYLLKAINLYADVEKKFVPFSDEWEICIDDLQKYKADFELLERGTYDERKGVIEKYGR